MNRKGAVGALLVIYGETMARQLPDAFAQDRFSTTQEILSYVVSSGFGYAIRIQNRRDIIWDCF